MPSFDEVVAALAARVRELEDRSAIAQLLAAYGPAVDSGSGDAAASLWVDDGVYDAGIVRFEGASEIAQMVATNPHQEFMASGAAHIVSPPQVILNGDRATAICYQQVVFRDEAADGYRVWRTSANRWELTRTPDGWKVLERWNRALDGSAEARELLRATSPA